MKEPQKQNRNQTAQRHAAAVVFGHVKTAFSCKTHSDPRSRNISTLKWFSTPPRSFSSFPRKRAEET